MTQNIQTIIRNGLWNNNQALVALLGLCPLLALSHTAINSLSLGIVTTLTLMLSNTLVSSLRSYILPEIRLPLFVLIIAGIVTSIELLMHAWFYELHRMLGIFIPLIATNCAIIGRAEVFASKNRIIPSLLDGLTIGLGFSLVLLLLGGFREILATGILFSQADLLFGAMAKNWQINVFVDYSGMLLALSPPGAFLALGLMVATKNMLAVLVEKQVLKRLGN